MKFNREHEEINPHVDARTVRPVQFGIARP